jgi:large subunit ribosomal protein L13
VKKQWYIVDATDKRLGRLASTVAIHIRGKNMPTYTPSTDMGAYVIIVNAEKVAVTGKKRSQKLYRRHSGRPGGMTEETFESLQRRIPERIIEHAVRGMLPKGRVGISHFLPLFILCTNGYVSAD